MTSAVSASGDRPAFVHDSAEIEPGVKLGAGTRVWRHSHIRADAEIGADCTIGANVFIDAGVHVGDRVKIQNNVSIYAGVELEADAFVGPAAVFTNDRTPRSTGSWTVSRTIVRTGASVGANATVVCGNELGEHCLVAAGAVVTKPVRPHQLVMGNPARAAGWVCRCGVTVSRAAERPTDLVCERCRHT